MAWPWRRRENRATSLTGAQPPDGWPPTGLGPVPHTATARPENTAAVLSAAELVGSALATAEVAGTRTAAAFPAELRTQAGEALARFGRWTALIDASGGGLRLIPAYHAWPTSTDPRPSTWQWRLTCAAPTGSRTITVPDAQVVALRWSTDPQRPWLGRSPAHSLTGWLLAHVEHVLSGEARGPSGWIMPVSLPEDFTGDDAKDMAEAAQAEVAQRLAALSGTARGKVLLQAVGAGAAVGQNPSWGGRGPGGVPLAGSSVKPARIGADPPEGLVALRDALEKSVLASFGIASSVVGLAGGGDGAARREDRRTWQSTTAASVANRIAGELAHKLQDPAAAITFAGSLGGDLAGRARGVRLLTEAGVGMDEAMKMAGLK